MVTTHPWGVCVGVGGGGGLQRGEPQPSPTKQGEAKTRQELPVAEIWLSQVGVVEGESRENCTEVKHLSAPVAALS
jgi:hypothetical protein